MIKKFNLVVIDKNNKGQKANSFANYLYENYKDKYKLIIGNKILDDCLNLVLSQISFNYGKIKNNIYNNIIFFLRPNIKKTHFNLATNGFSIYKDYKFYKYFILNMSQFQYNINSYINSGIHIGYYNTSYRNTQVQFLNFIKNNKNKIDSVSILGNNFNIKNFNYYTEKNIFFSNITHLVTPMSKTFIDPWPTVLEEGIRCNKQIIILKENRNFKDGIDDLCSCINYHEDLNDNLIDNNNSSIFSFNLNKYYNYMFNIDFKYSIERKEYKNFNEFLLYFNNGI